MAVLRKTELADALHKKNIHLSGLKSCAGVSPKVVKQRIQWEKKHYMRQYEKYWEL